MNQGPVVICLTTMTLRWCDKKGEFLLHTILFQRKLQVLHNYAVSVFEQVGTFINDIAYV